MTKILEIKDKVIKFCGEYESFILPIVKFVVALTLFMIINNYVGYMPRLNNFVVVLLLALVCSILPVNMIALVAGALTLLHMYSLCTEAAIVTLAVFAIVYAIYFRFAPTDGMFALVTPICFTFNCPFVLPLAGALMKKSYSVISMVSGAVCYYFLQGIYLNAKVLTNVSTEVDEEAVSKFNVLIGQFLSNKEMYVTVGVLVLAYLVVYILCRIPANHAWTLAIITGTVVEFVGLFIGYSMLNLTSEILVLLIGGIIAMLIAFGFQFLFMDLDYARTERVQFEDDDYYYYVKAVPKKMVASSEKTVKRFGNTGSLGKKIEKTDSSNVDEEISRKVIAKELDIDESWLK